MYISWLVSVSLLPDTSWFSLFSPLPSPVFKTAKFLNSIAAKDSSSLQVKLIRKNLKTLQIDKK